MWPRKLGENVGKSNQIKQNSNKIKMQEPQNKHNLTQRLLEQN